MKLRSKYHRRPGNTKHSGRRSPKKERGDNRRNKKRSHRTVRNPKFEGSEDELKGQVYILGYAQGETFKRTTKDILIIVGLSLGDKHIILLFMIMLLYIK